MGRWQGHADVPLNENGIAQAQALAKRLVHWPIQAIYSSDLQRAAQTAALLGDALKIIPIYDVTWRERHVGVFEGLTTQQIMVQYADVWQQSYNDIINPPEGEDHTHLLQRASTAFETLSAKHPNEMVAIVSHGGFLGTLISYVLGLPADQYGRFSLRGNTGLSIVEITERGPRVTLLNDTSHLGNNHQ